jgi:signal transduction histidine kinase
MASSAWFRRLLVPLLLVARLAAAAPVLDTVAKVRALTPEEAARELPVRIEATVIFFANYTQTLFVLDDTACTFVLHQRAGRFPIPLEPGMRVRIEGVTDPGDFFPVIRAEKIESIGKVPLPMPRQISESELFAPMLDSQWVEVPAVITDIESGGYNFTLVAQVQGWKLKVDIPRDEHTKERATPLMQRPVRIQGIAGTFFNKEQQMTGRNFFVPSFDQIIPTDTLTPNDNPPLRTVNGLLRRDDSEQTLVKVAGTVTQTDGNNFYLRDDSGSMQVCTAGNDVFAPGDHVEVEGFATVAPYRPVFRARKVAVTGHTSLPRPIPLDFVMDKYPHYPGELVTLDADFLARSDVATDTLLQCRDGDRFFEALAPRDGTLPIGLAVGDRVRLTGICELRTTSPLPLIWLVDGFRLHLSKAGGVVILRHAPWWTLKHVLALFIMAIAVTLVALAWVWLLRRRVKAQTEIIGSQLQREAVKDERQRIARELHDSVEQELASIAMQLDTISEDITEMTTQPPAPFFNSIEVLQKMLHHCQQEARTSIRDLRSVELEHWGLPGTLRARLPGVAAARGADFQLNVTGEPHALSGVFDTHLLRIAQEGVANAVRHADACAIAVDLDYSPGAVTLTIRDDGRGFDPDMPPPDGHFGLLGIQERANKMQAGLDIESAPGEGTTIRVVVPNPLLPP